ncbi:MAG: AMP-binding protein [Clostridia bacterium]|nr:AMP-binding protein [Clostridia bacterium]
MQENRYYPKRVYNFRELINYTASAHGGKCAFLIKNSDDRYRRINYKELRESYYRLCLYLIGRGLVGRRIAIIGKNSYHWILSYLAAATVGVAVPLDKELMSEDIDNFIDSANAALVLADGDMADKLSEKCPVLFFSEVEEILDERSPVDYARVDAVEIERDKMQILIFTSGTTGSSKGVCLSQYNICTNIYQTLSMVSVKTCDRTLSLLPLHHTYECTLDHLCLIYGGCSITYAQSLKMVARNLVEYSPSILVVVPDILKFLNKRIRDALIKSAPKKYARLFEEEGIAAAFKKISAPMAYLIKRKVKKSLGGKIRLFIVGAAELDTDLVEDFSALGIRTLQGYGLTECAPLLAGNGDFFFNPKSTGRAVPEVSLKIHEPNEDGVGEILAKGENIMLGYYNDEAATKAVFLDGWFCTGDLGRMDADGALYITGRKKNVIVTENGKNIYPEELESRLYAFSAISDVIVMAEKQDGKTQVKAKIFPNHDYLKALLGRAPSAEEIRSFISDTIRKVNAAIPTYKHIRIFEVLTEALEKTTTRKIKRYGNNLA